MLRDTSLKCTVGKLQISRGRENIFDIFFRKCLLSTVKFQFSESQFSIKSQFKVQNLVIKMESHIKKSRFNVKSRFKESKCADRGHSLHQDFNIQYYG